MTITTDMLLAAGCNIKFFAPYMRAYSLTGYLFASLIDGKWEIAGWNPKPRFRVKAKSVKTFTERLIEEVNRRYDNAVFVTAEAIGHSEPINSHS